MERIFVIEGITMNNEWATYSFQIKARHNEYRGRIGYSKLRNWRLIFFFLRMSETEGYYWELLATCWCFKHPIVQYTYQGGNENNGN